MTNKRPTPEQVAVAHSLGEALLSFLLGLQAETPRVREPLPPTEGIGFFRAPKQAQATEQLLIDARKAAALLSMSERTLWALTIPRGPIPAIHMGRSVRYSMEALRAWIQNAAQ